MKKKISLISFVFLLFCWLAGFMAFDYKINNYPPNLSKKTDAIVVLTGGRYRIVEAFKLFEQGLSQRVFISGVPKEVSLKDLSAQNSILLDEAVEMGTDSNNTVENAVETVFWIKKHNVKSIRLVTSNYHIPRSLKEFQARMPGLEIVVYPVYSDQVRKDWWKSPASFWVLFSEYNKFLYAYTIGRLS